MDSASDGSSLLDLQTATFSVSSHGLSSVWAQQAISLPVTIRPPIRTHPASFNLSYLLKALPPNSHSG